jgi:hypothetical protein
MGEPSPGRDRWQRPPLKHSISVSSCGRSVRLGVARTVTGNLCIARSRASRLGKQRSHVYHIALCLRVSARFELGRQKVRRSEASYGCVIAGRKLTH